MATSSVLPVIIRGQYDSGSGFSEMVQEAQRASGQIKRSFDASFAEIGRVAQQAVGKGLTSGGVVNVDVSAFREAAAQATAYRTTVEELSRSATALAKRTGDTSAATRSYLQALQAQAGEARAADAAAQAQLTTYSRLQAELDTSAKAIDRVSESYRALVLAQNSSNIASSNGEVRNRRFTEFDQSRGIGPQSGNSARDAARAFEEMFAAEERASQGATRLAADLELVKRAIDPTRVAQQQLDAELMRADAAFEQGAISANQYGAAVNAAADKFQGTVTGAREGTTAFGAVTNSNHAMRTAMVQSGQQLQDIAIQFQAGTRSSTILAQQLPQLAFAFSGVGGTVGAVARVFSGPWSLALVAASALLGGQIDKLLQAGDATDKTKDKTRDLLEVLRDSAAAWDEVTEAVKRYNSEQAKAAQTTVAALGDVAGGFAKKIADAQKDIADLQRKKAEADAQAARSYDPKTGGYITTGRSAAGMDYQRQIDEIRKGIPALEAAALAATQSVAREQAKLLTDRSHSISEGFKKQRDDVAALGLSVAEATKRYAELARQEKAALDSIKSTSRARVTDAASLAGFISPVSGGSTTGRFGEQRGNRRHAGLDIAVPVGTPVKAPQAGVVIEAGVVPGYGNVVYIDHGRGTISRLAHLSRISATKGQFVDQGDLVGLSGGARGAPGSGNSRGPHLHQEVRRGGKPVDPRSGPFPIDDANALQKAAKAAEAASRATFQLSEFAADANDRIGRMSESFKDTPPAIAQMLSGMATLDDLASDIQRQMEKGLGKDVGDGLLAQVESLRQVTGDSVNQPFKDMVEASEEQAAIQELLIAGRMDEAEVLSRIIDLQARIGTEEELRAQVQLLLTQGREEEAAALQELADSYPAMIAGTREMVQQERLRSRELEKQNELRQREVSLIESTRDNIRDTMQSLARGGGVGAIGDLFKRQFDLVLENAVDSLFEKAFGDFFRDEKDKALGFDKVREASGRQVDSIKTVTSSLDSMATALASATGAIQGKFDSAANDNFDPFAEIVVVGNGKTGDKKGGGQLQSKDAAGGDFLSRTTSLVARLFMDADDAKRIGDAFSKGLKSDGAAYGALAGGLIVGQNGSPLGASIGGALGEKLGEKVFTKGFEKIAKGLGDFAGPLGSILGGVAGSLIGSLMTSTPRASSTIGGVNGSLGIVSTRGNSAQLRKASEGSAGEAIDTLERIAEALGATIDASLGSVSIGVRKGNYRVDTSGSGITKTSKGAIDFGEDSAAAIRAATMDLIKDGVLQGLRDSTRRLLQGADDLDKAIKDALDFEGVFTRLKELKDPVGAALDALNKEFEQLIGLFQRAGASTEEFAALEELYGLERAKAMKDASESLVGPLKDLIADLETGNNGLSLRSRRENALAEFNPLAAAIRAGQTVDYNEFTDAARTLLEISRELFGSQDEYFATFNDILALSKSALADQENVISIADGSPSPFVSVDTVPVVQAVDAQSQMLLTQISQSNASLADILAAIEELGKAGGPLANGTYF